MAMTIGRYTIPQIRKAVVAWILAIISVVITVPAIFTDYIPETAGIWIANGIAILTAIAVFLVRNARALDAMGEGRPEDSGAPPIIE